MAASERGRNAIMAMPRDRVLSETDGPFGTSDGRPAFPWEAGAVVPMLSELWKEPSELVAKRLVTNLRRLSKSPLDADVETA